MEFEAEPHGFLGGPYVLSILPNFGKHVACRLWVDVEVSIIALFYLMICYLLFSLVNVYVTILKFTYFNDYFTYFMFMLEYFMSILLIIFLTVFLFVFVFVFQFQLSHKMTCVSHVKNLKLSNLRDPMNDFGLTPSLKLGTTTSLTGSFVPCQRDGMRTPAASICL